MFTLGERDTYISSVQHLLFLLCVCFKLFITDIPFGFVIFFFLFSSAKLQIVICLTSLHILPLSVFSSFCYREFSTVLLIFGADENGWCQPWNFSHPQCPFCIRFVFIGQWDQSLSVQSHWNMCFYSGMGDGLNGSSILSCTNSMLPVSYLSVSKI